MGVLINIDGELLPPERATVPVLDRGFLYGDSVYEVVRTYGGVPFALDRHLLRMEQSAARLGLSLPVRAALTREIDRTLAEAGNAESYVRIIVTRGEGSFGLAPHLSERSRLVVIVRPLELPKPEVYERGLRMAIVQVRRNSPLTLDPALKTGNYLNSVMALRESHAAAADDAIFLDLGGRVTEASTSNVFFARQGVVVTPPLHLGLLAGVTRGLLLQVAEEEGVLLRQEPFGPGALLAADEVFVSSTLREVAPVTSLIPLHDGGREPQRVGDGRPGPLTQQLLSAFRRRVAALAR